VEQLGIKNIPVKLENDGKCAALAEKYNGSLKEYKDCVFLCIGTGIGGAAFINNTFLKPTRNSGFEFGHMIIEKNGEQCKCGNRGCFEAYCSKRKFKQEMQEILKIDRYVGAKELTEEIEKNIDKRQLEVEQINLRKNMVLHKTEIRIKVKKAFILIFFLQNPTKCNKIKKRNNDFRLNKEG